MVQGMDPCDPHFLGGMFIFTQSAVHMNQALKRYAKREFELRNVNLFP